MYELSFLSLILCCVLFRYYTSWLTQRHANVTLLPSVMPSKNYWFLIWSIDRNIYFVISMKIKFIRNKHKPTDFSCYKAVLSNSTSSFLNFSFVLWTGSQIIWWKFTEMTLHKMTIYCTTTNIPKDERGGNLEYITHFRINKIWCCKIKNNL